ncbi:2-dehydropantoate 2-reductase [Natrialba magadii ATCC 43099]|uniref:2-dehydropantoate 2-reductase n=1 Tax=Natrialba magadii (strain ATCC 43099 / DSM 3394 / CCM 3739 / CIP 104546 / IAM 13178 / JCM 8861 / NBRC 102185 / NCIMB 2190 / MS3) TaxID=547559 RepID=D3SVG1_NATMM|nr:ketopantoate reductase family protein [Natrialba magadii]ADD05569.1 2-dehydropantoate 2-reductase [Natrialba magadii ATCC 43099]ELY30016.1 2-dehydropantoate 2-reductase [Natrialba magadii ATCC 43099]
MEVVVFGAGSLGSLVGGTLTRVDEHTVTLVAREPHASTIRASGLQLSGEFGQTVTPDATTDGRNLEADLAIVTVKSFDTPAAAETLATGAFDTVLSLQNGMGNEETLAAAIDAPVLAGTATYGAVLQEPGVVECTGPGKIVLGSLEEGSTGNGSNSSTRATSIEAAFERAGLETVVADDMSRRLWTKLAINAGINPVTALTGTTNEAVTSGPAGELAREAARETARVAQAAGVSLRERDAVAAMDNVATETAANTSSMAQDVAAGRRTEIDSINGYVVDQAAALGVDVPTNRVLTTLVRTWERGSGARSD